jgi:hypothetical protein
MGEGMKSSYLKVRFVRDFRKDKNLVGLKHYSKRLQEEYEHPGIVIETHRLMSNSRHYLTGKVSFDTVRGDTPVTALVRERLALAKRTILSDHASGYFTILGLTFLGKDYDPEEVLAGYRETPETTLEMVRSVVDGHVNAENVNGWLKHLITSEGLSTHGLINRINNILKIGDQLFQKGDDAYEEYFNAVAPELMTCARRDYPGIEPRWVWNHLITAGSVLKTANDSHLPSAAFNIEEVTRHLYRKFDKSPEATITELQIADVLSRFSAESDAGQMLRFGMFLASQLGMETLGKKHGAANLGSLHESLALTCEDAIRKLDDWPESQFFG